MTGELLWVYEGLTQYLGKLLDYRSGLWTPEYYRESLALTASSLSSNAGRAWRPLEDTAVEAQLLYGAPQEWSAYRRSVDFYEEGVLLWLDADMNIRKLTGNKRSLDDFCRRFYGGSDGDPVVKPYTFDDVVRALNDVAPFDWAAFLNQRLRTTSALLSAESRRADGGSSTTISRMTRRPDRRSAERRLQLVARLVGRRRRARRRRRAGKSCGERRCRARGEVDRGRWASLHDWTRCASPVRDSKSASSPMPLIFQSGEFVTTANVDYRGGLRYPHLERIPNAPDWLSEIGKPLSEKR